ncbi:MAG TPA: non-homologous end-joining DNA ligase [Gemmatimonadaceae bacterium]|nr:non-homologous end-joining DNA ligase [Gemmatimonadaceae bacterium]
MRKHSASPVVSGVRVSHPDRLVYPDLGITKLDVVRYYETIGDWMLPHVSGRPLTLVHCPLGLTGACTFTKHSRIWGPDVLRRVRIQEKKKIGEYLVADSVGGVVGIAQMSVLEIHTWNSTVERIEHPNRIVIDLDPGKHVAWEDVVSAARRVRKIMGALDLETFVKTTGGRGLHVVIPLLPAVDWTLCLEFSRGIAAAMEKSDPDSFTTKFSKTGRESKILIDYLRNNRTNTSIAAFSTRARPGAPVSVPLQWSELRPSLDPRSFTMKTVPQRIDRLRADPWTSYWSSHQKVTATMVKAVGATAQLDD